MHLKLAVADIPNTTSFAQIMKLEGYHAALPGIAHVLTCTVREGDRTRPNIRPEHEVARRVVYNGVEPANMSVQDYLIRLFEYGVASGDVYVMMLMFLRRFMERSGTQIHGYNIHRLMLTAFVVAAKVQDDLSYSNAYYAEMGGVPLRDLNAMERQFLVDCEFDFSVRPHEHVEYVHFLTHAVARAERLAEKERAQAKEAHSEAKEAHSDCSSEEGSTTSSTPPKNKSKAMKMFKNVMRRLRHGSVNSKSSISLSSCSSSESVGCISDAY